MTYTINENAKNIWIRDNENTQDLSLQTEAKLVYLDNGRTLEQELGEGSMVSNVATVDKQMTSVIDGTFDGAYESCMLEGRTLVNTVGALGDFKKNGTYYYYCNTKGLIKPNTKYYYQIANLPSGCQFCVGNAKSNVEVFFGYQPLNTTKGVITTKDTQPDRDIRVWIYKSDDTAITNFIELLNKIELVLIEYQDGMEDLEIPFFTGMYDVKMPILQNVGKNLLPNPSKVTSGVINGTSYSVTHDGVFTITGTATGNGGRLSLDTHDLIKLQDGKTYKFAMEKISGDATFTQPTFWLSDVKSGTGQAQVQNSIKAFTYSSDWNGLRLGYNVLTGEKYGGTYRLSIVEGNEDATYEPYKTNILTCTDGIVELTEDMFEQGGMSGITDASYEDDKISGSARIRTKQLMKINPLTTYSFNMNSEYSVWIKGYNQNKKALGTSLIAWSSNGTFTTGSDVHYVAIVFKKGANLGITPSNFNNIKPEIQQLDKTIKLRSLPDGTKDTLNVMTGEYIQRIGEITFDGSSDESWEINYSAPLEGYSRFRIVLKNNKPSCKLNSTYRVRNYPTETDGAYEYITIILDTIYLRIKTDKLLSDSVDGFKSWLQSNPLIIQYELATPIVKTVSLHVSNNNHFGDGIVLPNGVKDEYSPTKGVYTKRVDKTVFDGSSDEDWVKVSSFSSLTNVYVYQATLLHGYDNGNDTVMCDTFITEGGSSDKEHIRSGWYEDGIYRAIVVFIDKTKLTTGDVSEFRAYLQANPMATWYQLTTPQTIKLTPHLPNPTPFAYENGHVILESGSLEQSLLPTLKYSTTTNRTGQIVGMGKTLLKQEKQLSALEQLLTKGIIELDYNNTLMTLNLEIDEVI